MALFSGKTQDTLTLIIELQSSLVRGSLVRNRTGHLPEIFFSHGIQIPFQPMATSSYLIKMILRGATEIVSAALQHVSAHSSSKAPDALPKKIGAVHYVLSSPWIISRAKMLSVSFPKPTDASRGLVTGMVGSERGKLVDSSEEKFSIIEEKIFDVQLNGYSVRNWEGKTASDIGISYVMSIAGTVMIDKLRQVCAHAVSSHSVFFHSELLLGHIGIEHCVPGLSSYLLIHVHGELTDVAVVERGGCVFFGSYPFGVYTAYRRLSKGLNIGDHAADSMMTLAMKDHLDGSHSRVSSGAISDLQKDWGSQLSKLFSAGSYISQLPAMAFISARSHHDFFAKSFNLAYPNIKLRSMDPEDLASYVTYDPYVEEKAIVAGLSAVAISVVK